MSFKFPPSSVPTSSPTTVGVVLGVVWCYFCFCFCLCLCAWFFVSVCVLGFLSLFVCLVFCHCVCFWFLVFVCPCLNPALIRSTLNILSVKSSIIIPPTYTNLYNTIQYNTIQYNTIQYNTNTNISIMALTSCSFEATKNLSLFL